MRGLFLLGLAVLAGLGVSGEMRQGEKKPVEAAEQIHPKHRGRAYLAIRDIGSLTRSEGSVPGETILTSTELPTGLDAQEIIVSWNADTPAGTGLRIEARAFTGGHFSKYYTLALWSKDGEKQPRESVNGQKDIDGDVHTDTLTLTQPAERVQVRVTLHPAPNGAAPTLKYLGISLADSQPTPTPLEPNRAAWGKEALVPGKTQLGWPGGSGWCSPTSTNMTLAFWSRKLKRPEMDVTVPEAAHAIYDRVYDGTGNWPFNTAYAGSFPGMRAYVTRFSAIRELEDWTVRGLPVVVSVSYDLLKGLPQDNDPGHLMVCDGFDQNGDIVLNDPAHHPERGEVARRIFPRAHFLRAWNRSKFLVYLIYPEGTHVPQDHYGHWDSGE